MDLQQNSWKHNSRTKYEQMKTLRGTSVPEFVGHYEYVKENNERVGLTLLEYIKSPWLGAIRDLSTNEVESLWIQCVAVLNQIHACGVVHNDIAARNMFWNQNENRASLRLCLGRNFRRFLAGEWKGNIFALQGKGQYTYVISAKGTAQSKVV